MNDDLTRHPLYDGPDYAHPLQDYESRARSARRAQGGNMTGRVLCLVGAQYGSEGKGVLASHLADRFGVHVRIGGPNAGHSFMGPAFSGATGKRLWKMRSLPCGWVNPEALLVIGAGALVDLALLVQEIEETGTDASRVYVDSRAVLIEPKDRPETYALRAEIGATGEGVGPARLRRLARHADDVKTVGQLALRRAVNGGGDLPFQVCDTVELLAQARDRGLSILLEGTQGVHLDLVHGQWPYVTSHGTGAAQLLADSGLAPNGAETLLVLRTFPIRVGGNSGPLPHETTWGAVSKYAGRPVEEFTTVTGRLRRVGEFSARDVRKAILMNGPKSLALNFLDYLYPEDEGCWEWDGLTGAARVFVRDLQQHLGVFIEFVGTGGPEFAVIERTEP